MPRRNVRDRMRQRSGQFRFILRGQKQARGHKLKPARKRCRFKKCSGGIWRQLEMISERRRL
jgi:hypothetical protein